jgi:metallo-beta-lactamase superfamily protein
MSGVYADIEAADSHTLEMLMTRPHDDSRHARRGLPCRSRQDQPSTGERLRVEVRVVAGTFFGIVGYAGSSRLSESDPGCTIIGGEALSNPSELNVMDGCEILVLVDNVSDPLSTVPNGVTSEIPNLLRAGARELAGSCMCCAQWGLSLVLTVRTGDQQSMLLFDSGPEGYGIERNGARLGVDFGVIDAVVLSHGHFDHVGGMTTALRLIAHAKGATDTGACQRRDVRRPGDNSRRREPAAARQGSRAG